MTIAEKRKIWTEGYNKNKEAFDARIKDGIEKYRKGYCKLKIVDKNGKPLANQQVTIDQQTHDFGFGANIFMLDELENDDDNLKYRESFKKYFNLATVPFYWDGLEPEEGKPRYDKNSPKVWRRPSPDRCIEYCEENGITPKLHCLVYENFIPDWLPFGDMKEMEKHYKERFRQIAERYSGRLLEIEVINELLLEAGWKHKSVISDKHDITEWAFSLARQYFPDDTLVINEANPIVNLAKQDYRNAYYMLVENALKSGASIDKIGLQHHIFVGASAKNDEEYDKAISNTGHISMIDPALIFKGLDIMATFGLPLELTEVTIPTFGDTPEDEELQADLLELFYSICFSHEAVQDIVYWNMPDGFAFAVGGWDENRVRGGLLHHDYTPKKSADRLYKLTHEVWHTKEQLVTDRNGYVDFRGFFGEYTLNINGKTYDFGIHKGDAPIDEIIVF